MVFNQLSTRSLKQDLQDELRLNPAFDVIPTTVRPDIQPVVEVKKKWCNVAKTASNTQTSATVYTVPSDKDFYLVTATLAVIKDATATSTASALTVTIEGTASTILRIPGITLTAQSEAITASFPIPIKVDRGTNITISNTTNVANILEFGTIIGYTLEGNAGA